MVNYKSPLRYPGGKTKFAQFLFDKFPKDFTNFREPFVGGGSIFLKVLSKLENVPVWINDLNPEVYYFWQSLCRDSAHMVEHVQWIKDNYKDGKKLFHNLKDINLNDCNSVERAVRFFVLNRITFSGTIESGGYSQSAFEKRFTQSSIERLKKLEGLKKEYMMITKLDYKEVVSNSGKDVFIYCDPPYLTAEKSKLYGKNGDLHSFFNHEEFAETMKNCDHRWLISYDDCEVIRELFNFANIEEVDFQYSMTKKKGKELLITNY
jgi:DNA adenine methylase